MHTGTEERTPRLKQAAVWLSKTIETEMRNTKRIGLSVILCNFAQLLKVIAQAVTELDNKTAHRQPPVLDRHTPFLTHP